MTKFEILPTIHPLTLKTRNYFSTYYLYAANHFVQLAKEIEDSHEGRSKFDIVHRAYVTNSILSSVAFLEASINEIYQDASDNHNSYIQELSVNERNILSEYWRMTEEENKTYINMLDKYQLALRFCGKEPFNKGNNPYQNVYLVVRIRNKLSHFKPETLSSKDQHNLTDQLQNKFLENKLMKGSGNAFFPDKCLGYGCARWVFNSSKKFADTFFERLRIKPNYQRVDYSKMKGLFLF